MLNESPSTDGLKRFAIVGLIVASVLGVAIAVLAAVELAAHPSTPAVSIALLALAGALVVFGVFSYAQIGLLLKMGAAMARNYEAQLELLDTSRRTQEQAHIVAENSALSDAAKRVVYREKDYEFLRDTIEALIVRQDWEAAEHLIRDVAEDFGYQEEAGRLREQLETARRATDEERVQTALARVEQLCGQQKWTQALREAGRMNGQFGGDRRITELATWVESRRQDFKRNLLKEYDLALRTSDIDKAHTLLIQLDQYLAADEANSLKESARGVFRARLEQMRVQFGVAVSYKQFRGAVEIAETIIREYPNSGYAQELSKLMPVLRERAARETLANATPVPA